MPNRYANLDPHAQIRNDFGKITSGFDKVQQEMDEQIADLSAETAMRQAGEANLQAQVDTLVVNGDSSVAAAQAAVDASGFDYKNLKLRLDTEHSQVITQLTETTKIFFSETQPIIDDNNSFWFEEVGQTPHSVGSGEEIIIANASTDGTQPILFDVITEEDN